MTPNWEKMLIDSVFEPSPVPKMRRSRSVSEQLQAATQSRKTPGAPRLGSSPASLGALLVADLLNQGPVLAIMPNFLVWATAGFNMGLSPYHLVSVETGERKREAGENFFAKWRAGARKVEV